MPAAAAIAASEKKKSSRAKKASGMMRMAGRNRLSCSRCAPSGDPSTRSAICEGWQQKVFHMFHSNTCVWLHTAYINKVGDGMAPTLAASGACPLWNRTRGESPL